ncbi:non-ribosomal peptide synthetase [Brevibacillus migulae]|uniref:non-ribosomal peptide synthetase n=1 Tax=Brevibacillus migulae TaxID=1644114 RepID=UPI00142F5B74|nr:non-ribosomal peptide synthetase [Brevibacillus migulae]
MSGEFSRVEEYWFKRMEKPLPVVELPIDVQRTPVYEHAREVMGLPLSKQLAAQLDQLAKETNAEAQDIMLAAFFVWLHRLTHSEDLYVGMAVKMEGTHEVLPLRVSLAEKRRFIEVVDEVSLRRAEALEHASSPFSDLMDKIFTERDESKSYGYTACFQWVAEAEDAVEYPSEISWMIRQKEGELSIAAGYHPGLYRSHTMRRYAEIYRIIVEAMMEDVQQDFRTVDILTQQDKELYQQINQTSAPYRMDATIPQMFMEAARQFPAHQALSMAQRSLSYHELDETTNQVAHMLRAHGVKKGEYVALFMHRSIETVIGILAILKAGGVYIPIDPEYPEDRIRYMLEDSQTAYILTTAEHEERARELIDEKKVQVLLADGALDAFPRTAVDIALQPSDLAYIIYTSGSTGRPKGTLLAHQGVINLSTWMREYFALSHEDVVFGFASFSFDASVFEMFSALFWGARFHLLSPAERLSFDSFTEAVSREKGTFVTLPTAFFKQLAEYLREEDSVHYASMKRIAVAGEALTGEIVRKWQRRFGLSPQIINAYGPTECTVCSSAYKIETQLPDQQAHVPIGTPIANTELYVVSPAGQLCPVNVPGELYIGSVGMAVAYWQQPEKTKDAFIPHPFSDVPGARLYKSGDIVRLLPDGNIEYVGRKDDQVKIRGFRIEMGEIEDTIVRHEEIEEGVVIARKEHGEYKLIAYYTTKPGAALTPAQVRGFLASHLPEYMIPELIIKLEELPLTPNKKVDRKALAARQDQAVSEMEYVEPGTEDELFLASVWKKVLKLDRVGVNDDFFLIGGHSLKILHALALSKPRFPFLRIQDYFQHRTLGQLAAYASAQQVHDQQSHSPVRIKPNEIRELHESPIRSSGGDVKVRSVQPRTVLLTGATGYFGSHLLHELLKQPDTHVYCMVRPSPEMMKRVEDKIRFSFGEEGVQLLKDRVSVIAGDLTLPRLGMAEADRELLKQKVDAIIHAAADVRHFGEADYFYQVNVAGTKELLDIAREGSGIRFHYVSTISVPEELALSGQWEHVRAHGDFDYTQQLENVYANSKLMAEQAVREAIQAGVPATIYRAGNLVGHSKTGQFQENIDSNAFYRMIKVMLLLGKAPDAHMWVDLTPIDYASEALVALASKAETIGQLYHLVNPQQISYEQFINDLNDLGYAIDLMEPADYEAMLFSPEQQIDEDTLQLAMAQLEGDGARDSMYRFGCRETVRALAADDVACAAPDQQLIGALLSYAQQIGYFPAPVLRQSTVLTR